jgi:hypothetical protein
MHDFLTVVVRSGFGDRDPDDTDEVADLRRHIGDRSASFVPGVKTGAFPRQLSKLARGRGTIAEDEEKAEDNAEEWKNTRRNRKEFFPSTSAKTGGYLDHR